MKNSERALQLRQSAGSLTEKAEEIHALAESESRSLIQEELDQVDAYLAEATRNIEQAEQFERLAGIEHNQTPGVLVIEDEAPKTDWKRRTVRYFSALTLQASDEKEKGGRMLRELRKEISGLSDAQIVAEDHEAAEVIRQSELPAIVRNNLMEALEIRLHTTSTTDTPKAGHLLPKPFLAELFVTVEQHGKARQYFRRIPLISKDIDLKNVATKVVAQWVEEGANIEASAFKFKPGQLTTKKLAGLTKWTSELEEDQAIALLPVTQLAFAESISEKEDLAAFVGDGSTTYGSFVGLLNLPGAQVVSGEAGETDATFLAEADLRTMKNSVSESAQVGACWFMHRTFKDVIEQFENSAGNRIFQQNITGKGPDTLLGYPIVTVETMPAYSDVGADQPFLVFGNPKRALMGQRRGITADISKEAVIQGSDGAIIYNAFQADGALLRITERVGFKVPWAFEKCFAVAKSAAS